MTYDTSALLTMPGIRRWTSGVILYDETIRQTSSDGEACLGRYGGVLELAPASA